MKKFTIQDLEFGLNIDQDLLEEECATHSESFYHAAKEYALTVSRRDFAKQALAELTAEIDAQLRYEADRADEKTTEPAIAASKLRNLAIRTAQKELLELSRDVGEWGALKEAFEQRSYALRDMVQLWLGNYYGDKPTASAGKVLNEAAAERVKTFRREHSHRRTK